MFCRILIAAGYDGMQKVVDEFISTRPHLSKRSIERKIIEIAIKEKRGNDTGKVNIKKNHYYYYYLFI